MSTTITAPEPEEVLTSKALSIPKQAAALQVTDQATLNRTNDFIGDVIDPLLFEANSIFDPIIKAAHVAHKAALEGKATVVQPLEAAKRKLKTLIAVFVAEQTAVAERERRRLQAIADQQALEQRELEIEAAEAQGAPQEIVNAIIEAPMPPAPRITIAPAFQMPANVSAREQWSAEVFDHAALLRAIVAGQQPAAYCPPDLTVLNAIARSLKATLNIPGVRAVNTPGITRRSSSDMRGAGHVPGVGGRD